MLLFTLDTASPLATALAVALDESVSPHDVRTFEDGEHKLRSTVDPRGADTFVVASQ